MSIMSPEPESEFRVESEFRAKVYRMLALGLSTTEVENVLGRRIDWSLYSEQTLKEIMHKTAPSVQLALPQEFSESIMGFYKSVKNLTVLSQLQTKIVEDRLNSLRKFQKRTYRLIFNRLLYTFIGFSSIMFLVLLILVGVILFR